MVRPPSKVIETTEGTAPRRRGLRQVVRARVVAPLMLAGIVGVLGVLAFSPRGGTAPAVASTSAAAATTATTSTTAPSPSGGYESSTANPPDLKSGQPSKELGLSYLVLPKSYIAPGQALFAANCSSCHGPEALGGTRAPNLQGLGAGTIDFWVSTGRMPLADSSVQATRKPRRLNQLQTLEVSAWVQSLTPGEGVQIPLVNTNKADLEQGGTLFTLNCAACHTITGAGDALMEGAFAPSLHLATPTQVVEAIRSGPGNMPRFGAGNITNAEARDVAAYVTKVIQHPTNEGGVGLGGVGPVGEGFIGLLLGVGLLMLVCFWIGDRT